MLGENGITLALSKMLCRPAGVEPYHVQKLMSGFIYENFYIGELEVAAAMNESTFCGRRIESYSIHFDGLSLLR